MRKQKYSLRLREELCLQRRYTHEQKNGPRLLTLSLPRSSYDEQKNVQKKINKFGA